MRIHAAVVALAGLGLLGAGILAAGQHIAQSEAGVELDDVAAIDVMPDIVPDAGDVPEPGSEPERLPPRPPLSDLSTPREPAPPGPAVPERWRPTRVFNPVATAAGRIEANGYRIALAGLEPVSVEQTCSSDRGEWPCGVRARTEFRSWLRGRAMMCRLPPEPEAADVTTDCRVGNEDPAEWLALNGWAKAVANGPLEPLGNQAEAARKGLFGAPPSRVGATITPGATQGETPGENALELNLPPAPSE